MDGKRLRVHSKDAMEGRLFILFLSMILRCAVEQACRDAHLFKKYTVAEIFAELKKIKRMQLTNGTYQVSEAHEKATDSLRGAGREPAARNIVRNAEILGPGGAGWHARWRPVKRPRAGTVAASPPRRSPVGPAARLRAGVSDAARAARRESIPRAWAWLRPKRSPCTSWVG